MEEIEMKQVIVSHVYDEHGNKINEKSNIVVKKQGVDYGAIAAGLVIALTVFIIVVVH